MHYSGFRKVHSKDIIEIENNILVTYLKKNWIVKPDGMAMAWEGYQKIAKMGWCIYGWSLKSFRRNFGQKSLYPLVTAWIIACSSVHYSHSKEISSSWKSLITPRMLCLTLAMLEISTAHLEILHYRNIILYISNEFCMRSRSSRPWLVLSIWWNYSDSI